jgi:hypothetical protein
MAPPHDEESQPLETHGVASLDLGLAENGDSQVFDQSLACNVVEETAANSIDSTSAIVSITTGEDTVMIDTNGNNVAEASIVQQAEITEVKGLKLVSPFPKSPSCKSLDLIDSYVYLPSIPDSIRGDLSQPCVLGVDEAGRGPVLGKLNTRNTRLFWITGVANQDSRSNGLRCMLLSLIQIR